MWFKRLKKILLYIILGLVFLALGLIIYFQVAVKMDPPEIANRKALSIPMIEGDNGLRLCGTGRLQQNNYGLWELYLEGEPFEMGLINGNLTRDLIYIQEEAFVNRIYELVPSKSYLNVLKYFIAFFNRNMNEYIPEEYLQEIYGVSLSADDKFDFIGEKYQRILNYHSAHDIGHALQNMNLVGCTAFGLWDEKSESGNVLIGRNFDFHAGEAFNENKILAFVKPGNGHSFMFVTWGGMVGVVSGMNMKGLTITLNAAKSEIPYNAAMPVSILAREILQYASSIEEAYQIAAGHQTFVSESFLIGSGTENMAAVIEKTPDTTILYRPDTNYLILTNHFLDEYFKNDELNRENMKNTSTVYRYDRVQELLEKKDLLNVQSIAGILRDRKGLGGNDIGNGNEKAINQLIAHHSIIFAPYDLRFWISIGPYQLGEYLGYDLARVFEDFPAATDTIIIYEENLTIAKDSFLVSGDYDNFKQYRSEAERIRSAMREGTAIDVEPDSFIQLNPDFFEAYEIAGDWAFYRGDLQEAIGYYKEALQKEIPTNYIRNSIGERLIKTEKLILKKQ